VSVLKPRHYLRYTSISIVCVLLARNFEREIKDESCLVPHKDGTIRFRVSRNVLVFSLVDLSTFGY